MLRAATGIVCLVVVTGCAGPRTAAVYYGNPTKVPLTDRDFVWDQVVDVVDDYFPIQREERVKLVGNVLTEGRIDTAPIVGATLLEPWRRDSVDRYAKIESTLQTIQRYATVRVVPVGDGFEIDVVVIKELEDLERPEHATAGAATLRHDTSLARYTEPVGGEGRTLGWISLGRDTALEQQILADLHARLGHPVGGYVVPPGAAPPGAYQPVPAPRQGPEMLPAPGGGPMIGPPAIEAPTPAYPQTPYPAAVPAQPTGVSGWRYPETAAR